MSSKPAIHTVLSCDPDPGEVTRRFMLVNQARLSRVRDTLKPQQQVFLDLLPLLFHCNESKLPGYCPGPVPAGIKNYSPTETTRTAAQHLCGKLSVSSEDCAQTDLRAIYLMGSSGSIAHSSDSDYDVWVCHRDGLDEQALHTLQQKTKRVQTWATSLGLETHFFLLNDAAFRSRTHRHLSMESSGSIQHFLLLEEFYRTGLLIAGEHPAWWLVPPTQEQRYHEHLAARKKEQPDTFHQLLDFGGLDQLSASEFFGGALWQLSKGIESPYKSVLKILLVEAYSSEYPNVRPLSLLFKEAIYNGITDVDQLDPYMLMRDKIESYLREQEDFDRLEMVRRCFYFKVDENVSRHTETSPANWRMEAMLELVKKWGWGKNKLADLDTRKSWKLQRVVIERREVVDGLTTSYHRLSQFARDHSQDIAMDPNDMHLLGRKIFTAFEKKAGKIDLVNPGISSDLSEDVLTLQHIDKPGREGWQLYCEDSQSEPGNPVSIKQSHNLLELLTWSHLNGIIDPTHTDVKYFPQYAGIDNRQLQNLLGSLQELFPDGTLPDVEIDEFSRPARVLKGGLFINTGIDPLSKHSRHGRYLLTDHNDCFRYGNAGDNLAISFDLVVVTSWKEVIVTSHVGENALMSCLCDYLSWTEIDSTHAPPALSCFCFSSRQGNAISLRTHKLFEDVVNQLYLDPRRNHARFITHVGKYYYVLQSENGVPRYQRASSLTDLVRVLGAAQQTYSAVFFDRHTSASPALSIVYAANQEHTIQVFIQVSGLQAQLYIADEKGSLFVQKKVLLDGENVITPMHRFLQNVLRKTAAERVQFFGLVQDARGQLKSIPLESDAPEMSGNYIDVQVIGDLHEENQVLFTVEVNGKEFSTIEYGQTLFEKVTDYILSLRGSEESYPVYITDIDLSPSLIGAEGAKAMQTVHLLRYKKRIEEKLNR